MCTRLEHKGAAVLRTSCHSRRFCGIIALRASPVTAGTTSHSHDCLLRSQFGPECCHVLPSVSTLCRPADSFVRLDTPIRNAGAGIRLQAERGATCAQFAMGFPLPRPIGSRRRCSLSCNSRGGARELRAPIPNLDRHHIDRLPMRDKGVWGSASRAGSDFHK